MNRVQHGESATQKLCKMKKVQHGKRATRSAT